MDLYVVVRTLGDEPELLAASTDQGTAAQWATDLGEGHHVAPVSTVAATARVVHVWECRATVTNGGYEVHVPARLSGASRIVADAADVPGERVVVDDEARDLEAAVHGRRRTYVRAYAASAQRAQELAHGRARELADAATD